MIRNIEKNIDLPVTQAQFTAFSAEMRSLFTTQQLDNKAMEKRLDSKISAMDAKFEARFTAIDTRFAAMDAKFDQQELSLGAKIEALTTLVHSTHMMREEQNARNVYVLDVINFCEKICVS